MNEIKEVVVFNNFSNKGYCYHVLRIVYHDGNVIDIPMKNIVIRKENKK